MALRPKAACAPGDRPSAVAAVGPVGVGVVTAAAPPQPSSPVAFVGHRTAQGCASDAEYGNAPPVIRSTAGRSRFGVPVSPRVVARILFVFVLVGERLCARPKCRKKLRRDEIVDEAGRNV